MTTLYMFLQKHFHFYNDIYSANNYKLDIGMFHTEFIQDFGSKSLNVGWFCPMFDLGFWENFLKVG